MGTSAFTRQAQLGGGPSISAESLALLGNVVYVGMGPHLVAIDVSLPADTRILAQSEMLPGDVSGVLVLAAAPHLQLIIAVGQMLYVFEQPDAGTLRILGQVTVPDRINAMVYDPTSGILYASGSTGSSPGFATSVDLSDPAHPQLVSQVALPGMTSSIALVQRQMLYLGTFNDQGQSEVVGIGLVPGCTCPAWRTLCQP